VANQQAGPHLGDPDFDGGYFESLATEKATSVNELQNPTSWGLTTVTAGTLFFVGRSEFPDQISLLGLLVLAVLATHFTTRAMKGYINVVRWSLLQRLFLRSHLEPAFHQDEVKRAVFSYHVMWSLPLRGRDIVWKAVFELGFGYIFALLIGAISYSVAVLPVRWYDWALLVATVALIAFELAVFIRSPYMRARDPDADARRLR
jgi:hypothetical protein